MWSQTAFPPVGGMTLPRDGASILDGDTGQRVQEAGRVWGVGARGRREPAAWLRSPQPCSPLFPTAEKVSSLGKNWHRFCLKCEHCHSVLSPGGHAEVRSSQGTQSCICHCSPGTSLISAL